MGQRVLVTGGAGYIGSHAVLALRDAGVEVVVLDDLSTGMRAAVPPDVPLVVGSVGDSDLVLECIGDHGVGAIMHFAASIVVPASVADPLGYYRNNVLNSVALIETSVRAGVQSFIFSSTAAVYGLPDVVPVNEDSPTNPISPYGSSKLMTEQILRDVAQAGKLRYVTLRYFNVAGSDPGGRAGQRNPTATHLIKMACQTALGRRTHLHIFGEDYPTPDGTGVRDYIHVSDLAQAHLLALRHLEKGGESLVLNCGYGRGYSVRDVIAEVERAAGRTLSVRGAPPRRGDVPSLTAAAHRIRAILGWEPRFDDLRTIVQTALAWERRMPA